MKLIAAIDGGSTATRLGLYDDGRRMLAELEGAPANPLAYGWDAAAGGLVSLIGKAIQGKDCADLVVAAGISGCAKRSIRDRMARAIAERIHASRVLVTDDLRPILYANVGLGAGMVAVAGTGSCVVAQADGGHSVQAGGRGGTIGDAGSAHELVRSGLRAAGRAADRIGPPTELARLFLEKLNLDDFAEVPSWAEGVSKKEFAALASIVTDAAAKGDQEALRCVREQAVGLARLIYGAHTKAGLGAGVPLYVAGGLAEAPIFQASLEDELDECLPGFRVAQPKMSGHRAVVELAFLEPLPDRVSAAHAGRREAVDALAQTEARLRNSIPLDALSAAEIVDAMIEQDAVAVEAVRGARAGIAAVIEMVADAFRNGGRLIYAGAGTSGRLGVLDASECPPTFGVPPEMVVALIAGGDAALRRSAEGEEDKAASGRNDLAALSPSLSDKDVVIGIAASGTTPYVRGALGYARTQGARTVLLCCNPIGETVEDIPLVLDTGPEVLPGSTRLKAGTATKLALNMITTGAMARAGYVFDGWMIRVQASNAKLRRRAIRILSAITGLDSERAEELLKDTQYEIPVAVAMVRLGIDQAQASDLLAHHGGRLRDALESGGGAG